MTPTPSPNQQNIDGQLAGDCPNCGRRRGSHTLDDVYGSACIAAEPTIETPFNDDATPETLAYLSAAFADKLPGYTPADHVTIKAGAIGIVTPLGEQTVPILVFDFAVGVPASKPHNVARLVYLSTAQGLANLVGLVTDSAKAAIKGSNV